jgi:RNA polymerase sigma-70 factor, ECF subfamily
LSDLQARVSGLYEIYRDDIYRFLQGQGLNPSIAQEMTQDVFVDLFVAMRNGTLINSERAWLYTVASRAVADHWRRERPKAFGEVDSESAAAAEVSSQDPNPEAQAEHEERVHRVAAGLLKLPRERRICLQLRMRGLRYREIAKILHVSTSTVGEWLIGAIDRLREEADG